MGKAQTIKRFSKAWCEQDHFSTHSASRYLTVKRKRVVSSNGVQAAIERGELFAVRVVGLDENGKPSGRVQYAIPKSELLSWVTLPAVGRPVKKHSKLKASKA